ncbi:DegT/DnrJ/EryC1/StrS family aminotransferase [Desulforamulus ferrireducens]|uniref:Transcriptional regulator n=1 Tax=Desulforamulus ferrireducens TaxID=1833852 RepID=A0A1S6J010_9FIRM|nr:DegT/DnrJ/EryC1/StrS family aminotransferase [Desulforamulus ferrireducens]AQS60362.1 transcriptional regulator [Desulforamulus ferrireducens]
MSINRVPLLDLAAQNGALKTEIMAAVERVFDSGKFIMGPFVEKFEKEVSSYLNSKYALGVSSGTDALVLALMALGVGKGDAVITTTFSFFATGGAISRVGARPYFADIESDTYNICPRSAKKAIIKAMEDGYKVRAIIPVHLYGQCADMESIMHIANEYGLYVIEDAAQAIGSCCIYKGEAKQAGTIGHIGCFSFFPSKNLGCLGDGGLVTTQDDVLYDKLKLLRTHGARPKYYHAEIGGNFRLDAIQAEVLSVKLPHLQKWHDGRKNNAKQYRQLFKESGLLEKGLITLPAERYPNLNNGHIYNQFMLRVQKRDDLRNYLTEKNIGNEIYYPVPFHLQKCFADLGYVKGDCPEAESAANELIAIPVYPELTIEQMQYVVDSIKEFYAKEN